MRIGLDDTLRVYQAETLVAKHLLRSQAEGWSTVPEHHRELWDGVKVEQRPLAAYEEVA